MEWQYVLDTAQKDISQSENDQSWTYAIVMRSYNEEVSRAGLVELSL
jgi:hypothetical protein